MRTKPAKTTKQAAPMKPVRWIASAKRDLRGMPKPVRAHMGTALQSVQKGTTPLSAKPMAGLGKGLFEIVCDYDKDTYRSMYVVKFGEVVYVLDCFRKKSTQGIATPKHILDRIADRYAEASRDAEARKGVK